MRTAAVVGAAFLALGLAAVAAGILPAADAVSAWQRAWPVLLFVAAMAVVAALAAAAGVFDAAAHVAASWGRGRAWLLWLLAAAAALVCTVFLSLDTTAVLLTPAVAATARRARLDPAPFALAAVWMANAGSLLLPVSNLTNLLAQPAMGDPAPWAFAARMAAPAAAAAVIPLAVAALAYRRHLAARYEAEPHLAPPDDPILFRTALIVLAVLLPLLVSGIPVWASACAAAVALGILFAVRRPHVVRPALLPWRLLLFAGGLILAAELLSRSGAAALLAAGTGAGQDPASLLRLAGVGAAGANAVNNLPAYLALQAAAGTPNRLAALLIGVNAGSLITPWASLATLLWHRQLAAEGIQVAWHRYVLLGCVAAPAAVVLATLTL